MKTKEYEALYVLQPHLNEEGITSELAKFEDSVKNLGGTVIRTERQGRKKLAYPINKINDGYFVLSHINLPTDKMEALKRNCKLSDTIIRSIISNRSN